MKINKLIIVLISLVVIISAIYFIYNHSFPNKSIFEPSDTEYEQISASYDSMSHNLKMLKTYEKAERELLNEINQLSILQNIYQEEVINILNDILKSCNVKLVRITFSEVHTDNINETNSQDIETQKASDQIIEAREMNVSIELSSSYENLLLFIDKVQDSSKDISITNIRIINQEEGQDVQCAMSLSFYALPL